MGVSSWPFLARGHLADWLDQSQLLRNVVRLHAVCICKPKAMLAVQGGQELQVPLQLEEEMP